MMQEFALLSISGNIYLKLPPDIKITNKTLEAKEVLANRELEVLDRMHLPMQTQITMGETKLVQVTLR